MLGDPTRTTISLDYDAPPPPDAGTVCCVWAVWALLTAAALGYVGWFASALPFGDDWDLIPALTDAGATEGHGAPLPRAILLALGRLTGDCRTGMAASIAALAALAAAFIVAARRLRGEARIADSFFPLALLNWGQWDTLLNGSAFALAFTASLAGSFLAIVAGRSDRLTRRSLAAASVCLLLLPWCGVAGLVLAPALALWLANQAVARWRFGARRTGLLLLGIAVTAFVECCLGFGELRQAVSPTVEGAATSALQFLAMGLGPLGQRAWPWSAPLVPALLLGSSAVLVVAFVRRPEQPAAFGLVCFLAATAGLALVLPGERAHLGAGAGFASRHVTIVLPALCAIYLAGELCGGATATRFVQAALCIGALLLLPYDIRHGIRYGGERCQVMQAFERDVRAGLTPAALAERHDPALLGTAKALLEDGVRRLRAAGIGAFRPLATPR